MKPAICLKSCLKPQRDLAGPVAEVRHSKDEARGRQVPVGIDSEFADVRQAAESAAGGERQHVVVATVQLALVGLRGQRCWVVDARPPAAITTHEVRWITGADRAEG